MQLFPFFLLLLPFLEASVDGANVSEKALPERYVNLASGNALWTTLISDCRPPTMACVQKTLFGYLQDTFSRSGDVQITSFLRFPQNHMAYTPDFKLEAPEEPETILEGMARSLHGRGMKFIMNHDIELDLPEGIFEGNTLKISPRGFEGNGALVKVEMMPKQVAEARIFKKIRKFISERLMYALMAILLVIKLLAAKFLFFLPMMVGAVTAKKLLIKVLLFLFPVLHHFFKLCAYAPHGAKFHHHKHHISHVHHVSPFGYHHGPHHHHHHDPHDGSEVIRPHDAGPPVSLHHTFDGEEPHQEFYKPHEQELEYHAGPSFAFNSITHRHDSKEEENEVHSQRNPNRPFTPSEIESMVLKAEKEAMLKARLQRERKRIQEENIRLQEQLRQALHLQEKLKQQAAVVKGQLPDIALKPPAPPSTIPAVEPKQNKPASYEKNVQQAAAITYDPFYTPILIKIDKVLLGLGVQDEGCRERVICSMYKNPAKFSPHSNLLSAELSRDASELQKPTATNSAVVRFYRYVQAARDGQDKRDCLRLYPACAINTE